MTCVTGIMEYALEESFVTTTLTQRETFVAILKEPLVAASQRRSATSFVAITKARNGSRREVASRPRESASASSTARQSRSFHRALMNCAAFMESFADDQGRFVMLRGGLRHVQQFGHQLPQRA